MSQPDISASLRFSILSFKYMDLIALLATFLLVYFVARYLRSPWRHLPPGPRGYPLLGSALKLFDKDWLFRECKKYGDLVYLNAAGQSTIILNSQHVAADLLDRRASAFSGRPRSIIVNELLCKGFFFALEAHNSRWRRMRRAVHDAFSPTATVRYHDMQAEEAARLALSLASETDVAGFPRRFARFSESFLMAVTYDLKADENESILHEVEAIDRKIDTGVTPGAYLVELLPWMMMIPARFAKWKRDALEGHKSACACFDQLVQNVKARMESGDSRSCLMTTLIDERDKYNLSKDEVAWAAGTMFAIGTDTMSTALEFWTLAMVSHPETQRRAQEEIDAVIGHTRAPRVTDKAQLPYVSAIVRETLRWRAGLPLGVPHCTDEDVWYEGMFIPKGTVCFVNVGVCNRDPDVYGLDAEVFNPPRHLDEKGRLKPAPPDTKDEGHISFGFGRRICVGRHISGDALFEVVATILWAFNLEKVGAVDVEQYNDRGMTMRPKTFGCKFAPRFPEALEILAREVEGR